LHLSEAKGTLIQISSLMSLTLGRQQPAADRYEAFVNRQPNGAEHKATKSDLPQSSSQMPLAFGRLLPPKSKRHQAW